MDPRKEQNEYDSANAVCDGDFGISENGGSLQKAWEGSKSSPDRNRDPMSERGSTDSPASGEENFPEGGRAAWLSLAGCFCAWMASFGLMNTVGTFQAYLQTHQLSADSEAEVGWIFGLYLFMAYCRGVQAGPIFDAVGPRALTAAGSVCQVASMFLLGACSSKWYQHQLLF